MTPEPSPAAVGLRAPPASPSAFLSAAGRVPAADARRPASDGAIGVFGASPDHAAGLLRRLVSALGEVAGLVVVALAFPLVILAIGIPIALLVRLVMWIAGVG